MSPESRARTRLLGALGAVLAATFLCPSGTLARHLPALRVEIATAGDGSTVACTANGRRCEIGAGTSGACRVTVHACIAVRARGLMRLKVGGTTGVAEQVASAVGTLPGAVPRLRGTRFKPPLAPGCTVLAVPVLASDTRAALRLAGRLVRGPRARTRVELTCDPAANAPAPPAPSPPQPAPPPPPPGPPAALRFVRETIAPTGGQQLTSDVAPGDLDGDGAPDVVVSGFLHLLWYHNPDWAPSVIADGSFGRGGKTIVRDLDRDGRPDVITGVLEDIARMVWFRNGPTGWERHTFSDAVYCHDLVFGDLDGDGQDDAVCLDQHKGEVFWLAPPSDPTTPWTVHTIDPTETAMGSAIADIDRDGRPDVVAGRAWYRNEGGDVWTRHEYTDIVSADTGLAGFRDFAKVSVLDLDGDGRLDIFATLYAETPDAMVYAFLAPADPVHETWTAVPVDPGPLFGVHSQVAAAFDGTSRPQIMVGETTAGGFGFGIAPDPHLYIYRLLGAASDPTAWERTAIDAIGTHEAQLVDLDRDGRPDLIGHEENTDQLGRFGGVFAWINVTGP